MTTEIDPTLAKNLSEAQTKQDKVQKLFDYLHQRGNSRYDESVTQLEHALQCAHLAHQAKGSAEQITAALLHDIGHFLTDEDNQASSFQEEDWQHETIGAHYLQSLMMDAVTEPILLHVAAKRYLCTVDAEYYKGLSPASQRSFQLQGGKMSDEEVAEFESHRYFTTAVLLRRWDDGAKVSGLQVPGLENYRKEVEHCFLPTVN